MLKRWFQFSDFYDGEESKVLKKTKIISAFPACGKTYAFEKLNNKGCTILDSDSSRFSWIERDINSDDLKDHIIAWNPEPCLLGKGDGSMLLTFVKILDGNKIKVRNPEFPDNYIRHIKENIGKVDYIFVSTHKEVRDALIKNNLYFTLVYPGRKMKAEWVGRCFLRGSDEEFCRTIADNWDKWIDEMEAIEDCDRWVLGDDNDIDSDCLERYLYLGELIENNLI